jgi:hypothetical protein
MWLMMCCSCCLLSVSVVQVLFLSFKNLIVLNLCSIGWHESCAMIMLVPVVFLYILNFIRLCSFLIVMSKKLI